MNFPRLGGFSAVLPAFCILIDSQQLLPPTLLLARATSVSPLVAFAAPLDDAPPATVDDAPRATPSTPPLTGTLTGEVDVLPPGGASLPTELAELAEASRNAVIELRHIDLAAKPFELYRSAPPRIPGVQLLRRPDVLGPLYASFATLQALDTYSTWLALETGEARELNPVLTGVADNLPALMIVKGATAASSVYVVERLWKRNRTAAVVTMIGINAAYGLLVARNLRVGASLSSPRHAAARAHGSGIPIPDRDR